MVSDSKRSDVLVMEWVEGWPGSSVLMTPLWVLKAAGASTAAPAYPRGMAVRVGWGGLRLWGQGEVGTGWGGGLTLSDSSTFPQPLARLPRPDAWCLVAFFLPQPVW